MKIEILLCVPQELGSKDLEQVPPHLKACALEMLARLARGGKVIVEQCSLAELVALAYLTCSASKRERPAERQFVPDDPRKSCSHSHPMCDGCLDKLALEALVEGCASGTLLQPTPKVLLEGESQLLSEALEEKDLREIMKEKPVPLGGEVLFVDELTQVQPQVRRIVEALIRSKKVESP